MVMYFGVKDILSPIQALTSQVSKRKQSYKVMSTLLMAKKLGRLTAIGQIGFFVWYELILQVRNKKEFRFSYLI